MGISGLLPFLKRSTRPASVREFSGCTAVIDAYSWLHKGAFACADKLARGQQTDVHVNYCMKQVNMLLSHGVKPVLVFDGRNLPSKKATESKRRESRQKYRVLAADHLRAGRDREARECFQRCVDITPAMARALIRACRSRGVDCVVAPYEADAQLAFLARRGIADLVITEDSDLVLFGCPRILFKMDACGSGRLVTADQLPLSLTNSADKFSLERLRLVCILSGCDYLASLPGIGLGKASKLFVKAANAPDIEAVLQKLPSYLNMKHLVVTNEYKADVLKAENTFLYQLVFDPVSRRLLPLTPYPPGKSAADYPYAGEWQDDETALQYALGNIDLSSGAVVDSYSPDRRGAMPAHSPHQSIWSRDYTPSRRTWSQQPPTPAVSRVATAGKTARLSVLDGLKKAAAAAAAAAASRGEEERRRVESDIASIYGLRPPGSQPAEDASTQESGFASGELTQVDHDDDGVSDADLASLFASPESSSLVTPEAETSQDQSRSPRKTGAPQANKEDGDSPVIGSGRSRNPFRVRGALRERLSGAAKRRLCTGNDGLTQIVTSQYFTPASGPNAPKANIQVKTAAPDDENVAADPLRAPVQSMEEFLKRRRVSGMNLMDSSPKRVRRSSSSLEDAVETIEEAQTEAAPLSPQLSKSQVDSAGAGVKNSWYKMSSVFDPKHAMTVWDSEVHGLRKPTRTVAPPSLEKENSPVRANPETPVSAPKRFLGRTPPASSLFRVGPQPTSGASGVNTAGFSKSNVKNSSCRKVGLGKPAPKRQLNLKQMFAYKKTDAPKLQL